MKVECDHILADRDGDKQKRIRLEDAVCKTHGLEIAHGIKRVAWTRDESWGGRH
jgi:hypothetical protein